VSRLRAFLAVLLLVLCLPNCAPAQKAPDAQSQAPAAENPNPPVPQSGLPSIQVEAGLVHLMVTVTDRKRNLITDLEQNDFKVTENAIAQSIRFFGRDTDLPLRIGLLLDTSNSIRSRLSFEQEAAIDFLTKVIRRDKDMAFLMTFDNEPEVIQDFTGDVGLLAEAIHKQRAGGGTALDDAIYRASEILSNPPLPKGAEPEVRRVIVVLSDGDDNLSERALSDAIEASIRAETVVYAISTNTEWLAIDDVTRPTKYQLGEGDKVLQEFADQTGGRVFFPYKVDDLAQSFLDIGAELRSQYFIAYAPTVPLSQGKYRRIEIQVDRKNVVVRSRKGYYPVAPTTPAGG
jgi:VWFA-related protein